MTKEENPQNRDFPLSWKAQTPRFPHSHRTATAPVLAASPHQSKSRPPTTVAPHATLLTHPQIPQRKQQKKPQPLREIYAYRFWSMERS